MSGTNKGPYVSTVKNTLKVSVIRGCSSHQESNPTKNDSNKHSPPQTEPDVCPCNCQNYPRMPHGTARAPRKRSPQSKIIFFSTKKIIQHRKNRGTRNVISRWWEGHQSCAALVKGLPYSSSNNGHEQDLEKYAYGGDSHGEG